MEVNYSKAGYRGRLFAFFFDLMCMVILGLGGVFLTQTIMNNVPYYKAANRRINEIQLSSHLYAEREDGTTKLLCDYLIVNDDSEYEDINKQLDEALTEFYSDPTYFEQSGDKSGMSIYNSYKIPTGQDSSDLFIYEDETHSTIVKKSGVTDKSIYDFYVKVMSENAVKYVIDNPDYISSSRTISLSYYFIILLVPISSSVIIFEYIIPLCLRRGKKTLGKLVFKLAVLDVRGLSCTWKRYTLRFIFFFFVEFLLSVVTFAIPLIISFTLLVFNKAGQSLHDYVINTYVVEAPTSSVMLTAEEYIAKTKKSSEFVLDKDDVVL